MPRRGAVPGGVGRKAIRAAGGGKKAIKAWRSLNPRTRTNIKRRARGGEGAPSVLKQVRRVMRNRRMTGRRPGSGRPMRGAGDA